ncbi:MAG: hypothetical protein GJT30_08850 [Geobacter sp.]|nr:hypothetical protein [Geobacter sp.]
MSTQGGSNGFLGTGWGFPPEFAAIGKGVRMVSEEDDIRESLRILLSTTPGERIMYPEYGCGLKSLAFAGITSSVITGIKDMIESAVLFFEPRITLETVLVDTGELYDGVVKITLDYTVRTTNSRSNMVYPFYLREGTNIGG